MTHESEADDRTSTAGRAEIPAEMLELGRLRIERPLIEAARDYYYHRWLADEELIGQLRLRVKHLERSLVRIKSEEL